MTYTKLIHRDTKYCQAIKSALKVYGHATNKEILDSLRMQYGSLSATTVHRATARLAERGEIGIAPVTNDGAMRYDFNYLPHDHFLCLSCDKLHDVAMVGRIKDIVEKSIAGCEISGPLLVSGVCKSCNHNRD